ncbi:ABC transporter permease [Agaricicola taiwanensis]|uniref:ABC transporter permease n=1 Tax=Agaricicola taiwanensis TaxID=591372 RepID=A0A8J2VNW0_9RHOB|nr:ABC transporter permease [Agaricicola taiwanensis]GGE31703.1 ABC transporter permease [Agaricicola taiwanensis]
MSMNTAAVNSRKATGAHEGRAPTQRKSWAVPLGLQQLLVFVSLLATWQITSLYFSLDFWISSPVAVYQEFIRWYASGTLLNDLRMTLTAAGSGFVIGSIGGAIIGFLLGWIRKLGDLLEPLILSLYSLPKVALAPLFVLWFGIGITNKIMFAAIIVFFMVFFTTFQGTRQVDRDMITNARLLGASKFQTWTRIAIPYSSIWVITGLRIGLPYALIGAIVGEFVAANAGVGYRIKEATSYFNTSGVFAGLIMLMLISFTLLGILKLIEKRVLYWQTAEVALGEDASKHIP